MLGALDTQQQITPHGRALLALPVHPRLAHMLLRARSSGLGALAAATAACLDERDILHGAGRMAPADLRLRVELVMGASASALGHDLHGATPDRDGVRRVRDTARELAKRADVPWREDRENIDSVGELIALAFPDRISLVRPGQSSRFLLRNGAGASLAPGDALEGATMLAIAELDGAPPEYRIARAAPIDAATVRAQFMADMREERIVEWDDSLARVRARTLVQLGALVLEEVPLREVSADEISALLLGLVRKRGLSMLSWTHGAERLRERLAFMHVYDDAWPDVSDAALVQSLDAWLAPALHGVRRFDALGDDALQEALLSLLPWSQRALFQRLAPTHLEVPSGSRIAVDYTDPQAPVLAVKLQEVFGWTDTPALLDGRVPLTLHLLSPAQRPVQVTRDLAGFWRDGYFAVRKELRGRYPRHPWPDDPLTAPATRRAKPRV